MVQVLSPNPSCWRKLDKLVRMQVLRMRMRKRRILIHDKLVDVVVISRILGKLAMIETMKKKCKIIILQFTWPCREDHGLL